MEPSQTQSLTSVPAVLEYIEKESFRMIFGRVLADRRVDRHEKEDIRQELIMSMLKAAREPDGIECAPHYINRTVTLILRRTRKKSEQRAALPLPHDLATFGAEPVANAIGREDRRAVIAAMACLDWNERILCNLKKFGYSDSNLEPVAELCGQSVATVHRRVDGVREKLRHLLQDNHDNLRHATAAMVEHHLHTLAGVQRWRYLLQGPFVDGSEFESPGGTVWPTVHVLEPGRAIVYFSFDFSSRVHGRFLVSALSRPWFAPESECVWRYKRLWFGEYDELMLPKHAETLRNFERMPAQERWDAEAKGDIRYRCHLGLLEQNELSQYLKELVRRYKEFIEAGHTRRQFFALHGLTPEGVGIAPRGYIHPFSENGESDGAGKRTNRGKS